MPGLEPRPRAGIFYAVGTVAGERIRKSLGTRDRGQAAELCAKLETDLWKRSVYGEEAVRTFEDAAVAYQVAGKERRFIRPLLRRFKGRVLGTIRAGEIKQAAREIIPDGKPATWNRQVIVPARAVINHAAELGWCPKISVAVFPVEKVQRKHASREWLNRFLAQADADKLPHLAAAVLFMHQTATRVSEAARVMPEHVDLTGRVIVLPRTKEDQWETRHITLELMVRLANLPTHPDVPLFRYADRWGIYRRMKAVCRRAGLPWRSPHEAGRHSFASNALSMGANPKQVMEAGGWKTAKMVLEIYAHANDAGKEVAAMFDTVETQDDSDAKAK